MSQITDAIDSVGEHAPDERMLGHALCATSLALLDIARGAFEKGASAGEIARACLPSATVIEWPSEGDVASTGRALAQTSYRGYVVSAFGDDASLAQLATMRLVDELPFVDEAEAIICHSLIEAARASVRDVREGVSAEALLGADVESRIERLGDVASPLAHAGFDSVGEAVIAIDRAGNVAIATTGPAPFVVDRADRPWLVGVIVGEPVLALASFFHAAIDRALPLEEAIRAPRLVLANALGVHTDAALPPTVCEALTARGHALEDAVSRSCGLLIAAISPELYREATHDVHLLDAHIEVVRGDPPPAAPMPARGQNFSVGAAGHKE